MNNNQLEQSTQGQEPRLPRIDPITFSALTTLDGFVAKAPLTRQEHAEANKVLQHLVQTVEMLQAAVKDLTLQLQANSKTKPIEDVRNERLNGTVPMDSSVVAEAAEEMFRRPS